MCQDSGETTLRGFLPHVVVIESCCLPTSLMWKAYASFNNSSPPLSATGAGHPSEVPAPTQPVESCRQVSNSCAIENLGNIQLGYPTHRGCLHVLFFNFFFFIVDKLPTGAYTAVGAWKRLPVSGRSYPVK